MTRDACLAIALALILAGVFTSSAENIDYRNRLDLLRVLAEKPWIGMGPLNRWDRGPRIDADLGTFDKTSYRRPGHIYDEDERSDGDLRASSDKRSAVANALNSGRRRRQPTPALGVLNDVGSFFDSLRDNLEALATLTPQQRSALFHETPTVVHVPAAGGGGGGTGIRRLHALRPLRPTGNIRSYNRRSFVEGEYPGANQHDPGLLWTGLGRR